MSTSNTNRPELFCKKAKPGQCNWKLKQPRRCFNFLCEPLRTQNLGKNSYILTHPWSSVYFCESESSAISMQSVPGRSLSLCTVGWLDRLLSEINQRELKAGGRESGWSCIKVSRVPFLPVLCCLFLFPQQGEAPLLPLACTCASLPHFTEWSWESPHELLCTDTVKKREENSFPA